MASEQTVTGMPGLAAAFMLKERKHHKTVMVVGGILIAGLAFGAGVTSAYMYNRYKIREERRRAMAIAAARRNAKPNQSV